MSKEKTDKVGILFDSLCVGDFASIDNISGYSKIEKQSLLEQINAIKDPSVKEGVISVLKERGINLSEEARTLAQPKGLVIQDEGKQESSSKDVESKTEPKGSLYQDLIFACTIPKAFKKLSIEQKEQISILNQNLFGDEALPFNIRKYSLIIKSIKHRLFELSQNDLKITQENSYLFVPQLINALTPHLQSDTTLLNTIVGEAINYQSEESKRIKAAPRISRMMLEYGITTSEENLDISKNQDVSANDTYIVTDASNNRKYYAKTFSDDPILGGAKGKLHPNELFIYKVMEYTGFGPRSHLLLSQGSSSAGLSSIFKGNFILTEDVAHEGKEFLLDLEHNEEDIKALEQANPRKFASEISKASAINDILSLADTFGANARNYGIVRSTENLEDYKIQFIDHLPNSGNGLFSVIKTREEEVAAYSPREALAKKYGISNKSPLAKLAIASKEVLSKADLRGEIDQQLFNPEDGSMPLLEAIAQAQQDVRSFIEGKAGINFIDNAAEVLDKYCDKIRENIEVYHKSSQEVMHK